MIFKKIFFLLCAWLSVSACFENDMPYPLVKATISTIDVEGALSYEVDYANSVLTLKMEETQDLRKVNIRGITFGEELTRPVSDIIGVHDLTSPLFVSLYTYQNHVWKIQAEQDIERMMEVRNQVGRTTIDAENHRVLLTVSKTTSLTYVAVDTVKLGPKGITQYSVDLKDVHDFTEPVEVSVRYHDIEQLWKVYVEQSDKNIIINRVSPWSRCAWIDASGLAGNLNGVRYRLKGEELWREADTVLVDGGAFSACVDSLTPLTAYEYVAYTGEEESEIEEFTTEGVGQLPNRSFEHFAYAESDKYYSFFDPASPNDSLKTKWWDNGNEGTAIAGTFITYPDTDLPDSLSGSYSAKLESANVIIKFACGNLYSGEFAGLEGTKGGRVNYGRPFTLRPRKLTLKMKYVCGLIDCIDTYPPNRPVVLGEPDECKIFIALGTWDFRDYGGSKDCPVQVNTIDDKTRFNPYGPDVVAYGEYASKESSDGWQTLEIPLVYQDYFTVPTHIIVSFAASSLGDYFTGSSGSRLWVDDLVLTY